MLSWLSSPHLYGAGKSAFKSPQKNSTLVDKVRICHIHVKASTDTEKNTQMLREAEKQHRQWKIEAIGTDHKFSAKFRIIAALTFEQW